MNDSNFARSRTLFLLPFSDVRRSALFGVVAMALTLSACGSDTAQESLIEALADVEGLEVEIDDDDRWLPVRERRRACGYGIRRLVTQWFPRRFPDL